MEPVKQFLEVPYNIIMEGYSVTIKYYESLKPQSPNSYTESTVFLALSEGYQQAYPLKQVLSPKIGHHKKRLLWGPQPRAICEEGNRLQQVK